MKEQLTEGKCERCKEEEATHLLHVHKHSVFVETKSICKECFDFRIVGGK